MKSYQLAAAVLTALATTAASAESEILVQVQEYKQKTMCVPVSNYEGSVQIISLCDASTVNKNANLKLDGYGCAAAGQSLEKDGNGNVYEQASMTIWGETEEELQKQSLPACENYDAAAYWVEL
jgi:hypothetical protein